ncbi:MAG TPA: VirB8/TrbF family protein [Sphingomicrobium sp.]|jgi:type IV secretion system protein VirB8|nr:VirB8/TrbF family protein [Sphingomicrobium sp.]
MNEHSREALDAYYAEAASWNRDRVQAMRSSHRTAWWIAGIATALALLEGLALVLLMPLKTVEPYTLMVDRTTGYVQALKPLDKATVAPDAALTQSFLVQYVIAREGFDMATLNANYRKVALFSSGAARTGYLQTIQVSNPQSPLVLYPRSTVIDARVKSVSPIGNNAALVRFDVVRTDAGAQPQPASPWVAVVRYRYSTEPMKLEDRFVNPLGFQVTSYRRDPEAVPPSAATPPSAAPAANAAPLPYYAPVVQPQQSGAVR